MESLNLEEENVIKDIINLFRLENETKAIKDYLEILGIFFSIKKNIIIN